jgi:hypothetical protein
MIRLKDFGASFSGFLDAAFLFLDLEDADGFPLPDTARPLRLVVVGSGRAT